MIVNHLFPVNQTIDSVFAPENLGPDCMWMAHLMGPVENAIEQYLFDELEEGLIDLSQTEACQGYGCPSIENWLDDMKAMYQ